MATIECEGARADVSPGGRAARAIQAHPRPLRPPLWLFAALAVFLLFAGAVRGYIDAKEYQCYALAFWHGSRAATAPSAAACAKYLGTTPAAAFFTLPKEYGPLAMGVFSLPLLGPAGLYPWLFAVEMLVIVLGVALLLHRVGPFGAGHAWLLYAMLGSAAVAAARFNVAPAACTLLALIALRRGRHGWAYLALAAGTLLKLYPALLLPLFLIESWRVRRTIPFWRGPGIYAACCAAVEGLAWLLNPASVLGPLTFMQGRCVQVESLPATLSALIALTRDQPLAFSNGSNSICSGLARTRRARGGLHRGGVWWASRRWSRCTGAGRSRWALPRSCCWRWRCWAEGLQPAIPAVDQPARRLGVRPGQYARLCRLVPRLRGDDALLSPFVYRLLLVALRTYPDKAVPITAGLRNVLLLGLVAATIVTVIVRQGRRRGYAARTSRVSRAGG